MWNRLKNKLDGGSIILSHNGTKHTADILDMLIKNILVIYSGSYSPKCLNALLLLGLSLLFLFIFVLIKCCNIITFIQRT